MQVINISSSLGSIGTLQGSLDAAEGSLPAMLSHYHLAYRSSKAALNMRKTHALNLGGDPYENVPEAYTCVGVSEMKQLCLLSSGLQLSPVE